MEETTFTSYQINYPERIVRYSLILGVVFLLSSFSFFAIIIVSRSTNFVLLVIPILLLIFFFSLLPSYLACFSSFSTNQAVRLTNLGVYFTNLSNNTAEKFLSWEKIKQYDLKNPSGKSIAESLFSKPTRFSLVGVYEEESLVVDAFGVEAETMIALLKEHKVPFGFLKS